MLESPLEQALQQRSNAEGVEALGITASVAKLSQGLAILAVFGMPRPLLR